MISVAFVMTKNVKIWTFYEKLTWSAGFAHAACKCTTWLRPYGVTAVLILCNITFHFIEVRDLDFVHDFFREYHIKSADS